MLGKLGSHMPENEIGPVLHRTPQVTQNGLTSLKLEENTGSNLLDVGRGDDFFFKT